MKKLVLKTQPEHANQRLDAVLAAWLPEALGQPVSKSLVRKLVVAGAVYLNGRRIRIASKPIIPNARIEVMVDLQKLEARSLAKTDQIFRMTAERILFEDEYLIVVNKPPGLPTQPTLDEARDNLFAAVKKFLATRDSQAQPYLGLHHRLDRDTSGVILFTKKVEANAGVAAMFRDHLAQKTYHALCHAQRAASTPASAPAKTWVTQNYLGRDKDVGKKKGRYRSVKSGGDFAETEFRVLESFRQALWVEAKPKTGRTHQIRVHLSESGLPILGDATYGGLEGPRAPRLMLHAVSLTFPHPITHTEVSILSPEPKDFAECLQALRSRGRPD